MINKEPCLPSLANKGSIRVLLCCLTAKAAFAGGASISALWLSSR